MIEFLQNYRCLVDTNVWLQVNFRNTVAKSAPMLEQLRVPYLVNQELNAKLNDDELRCKAAGALKFIKEQKIEILPKPAVSCKADGEIIICCMEDAGAGMALITNDKDLKEDLKEFSPTLLTLGWDNEKGVFSVDTAPGYETLVPHYKTILAGPGVTQREDFTLRAAQLQKAGIDTIPLPANSLLMHLLVHNGEQRALLLMEEGEDCTPYMDFRNRKLKSADNTGFDVAFIHTDGTIEVLKPQEAPLPKRQTKPDKTNKPAYTQAHLQDIKENLRTGKFKPVKQFLDTTPEIPKSVLNFYFNKVLLEFEKKEKWTDLTRRFTGKEGKKILKSMINKTDASHVLAIVEPKLKRWKEKYKSDTTLFRAFDNILQAAKEKSKLA